jgi:NAD(P)H-nitrite reductase large subunit
VKFVQSCLGTEICRYGSQDSIGLALMIGEMVKTLKFAEKIKNMGIRVPAVLL